MPHASMAVLNLNGPFDTCKQTLRGGRVKLQTIMMPETEYQHTEKVALLRSDSGVTCACYRSPEIHLPVERHANRVKSEV